MEIDLSAIEAWQQSSSGWNLFDVIDEIQLHKKLGKRAPLYRRLYLDLVYCAFEDEHGMSYLDVLYNRGPMIKCGILTRGEKS